MVTILPPKENIGGQLGQAIGGGFQRGFENASTKQFETQRAEKGLSQALKDAEAAKGDPVKLAFAFAKAGVQSPLLERIIGPLSQETLKQVGAGQTGSALQDAANQNQAGAGNPPAPTNPSAPTQPNAPTAPAPAVTGKGAKEVESTASEYLNQLRPDLVGQNSAFGNNVPTFDFEAKSDLRPDEEGKIREDLFKKKYRPETIEAVVNRVREDMKSRWNEANTKFNIDATQRQAMQTKWKELGTIANAELPVITKRFPEGTRRNLQGKYFQYAAQQPINLTPEAINTNAQALLQKDMNQLDALAAIPQAPPFRSAKDFNGYIGPIKEAYKSLVQNGFEQAVREDAVKKDLGLEGMHQAIWGDQTSSEMINKLESIKPPNKYYQTEMGGRVTNTKFDKENSRYVENLSNAMSKIKPEDDLILLRAAVLDAGGTEEDFTKALQQSKVKLSPFQESQRQELQIPRKPPLWTIFSEGWDGIKTQYNIIRGKR